MIQLNNVIKSYGAKEVLNISSLEILIGESIGLIGNNGAGKTTLFNLLLDLIQADTGTIFSNSHCVSESEEWKSYTGSFIDESFLIGYLTANEYFNFLGELNGMNKADVTLFLSEFKEFFGNEIFVKKKYLRDLSKGNQKKVGVVGAFMGNPKVVILDEPFANLDPSTQMRLKSIIKRLTNNNNVTVIISSHDLNHVTDVSDRIILLDEGKIVKDIKTSSETLKELESYFVNQL